MDIFKSLAGPCPLPLNVIFQKLDAVSSLFHEYGYVHNSNYEMLKKNCPHDIIPINIK